MITIILAIIGGFVAFDVMTVIFTILLGPIVGPAVSVLITVTFIASIFTRGKKEDKKN